jgi:hypothetical protein
MDRLTKPKAFLEKLTLTDADYQDNGMINHIADLLERYHSEQLRLGGSLPSTSDIEQKCDFVAMKDGYDITGGGTVADFTDGFMKGALWMKQVVESGGNDR